MSEPAKPTAAADAELDSMAVALRDAGADEPLPPELRRRALDALWVADAARHERTAAWRSRLLRRAGRLAAVFVIVACGVAATALGVRSWRLSKQHGARFHFVRNARPPVTAPATVPAETEADVPAPSEETPAVVGHVRFVGTPPVPERIDLSGDPQCAAMHPGGLFDESFVVGNTGGLANMVVSVVPADGRALKLAPPFGAVVLDQKRCRYVPRVLAVRVGQSIVVKNSDRMLHNVRMLALKNPQINIGQPGPDLTGYTSVPMVAEERFRVDSSVRPWMRAWVNVFAHPYFAVTDANGAYSIPGPLPDGRYTITLWHERMVESHTALEVKGGKVVTLDFAVDGSALKWE